MSDHVKTLERLLEIDPDAMGGWSVRELQDTAHAVLEENERLRLTVVSTQGEWDHWQGEALALQACIDAALAELDSFAHAWGCHTDEPDCVACVMKQALIKILRGKS